MQLVTNCVRRYLHSICSETKRSDAMSWETSRVEMLHRLSTRRLPLARDPLLKSRTRSFPAGTRGIGRMITAG